MTNKARFVLSKSKLLEQYNAVKNISGNISYSLKTNPVVGKLLEENTDSWFTVHFMEYLDNVKDKNKVWFVGQSWSNEELNQLFEKGVRSFIVYNEVDLNSLIEFMKSRDDKINILLRMRMKEHTIRTEKYYVFGMFSQQINNLIPQLRQNRKIDNLGVHFNRKTQNISEWSLKEELSEVLHKDTLKQIDILNIGGGIPIQYKNYNVDVLPHVFSKIKELKEWLNGYNVKMIIEPGRFVAGPCIKLEAKIIGIHDNTIVVNCSVYNSSMDTIVANIKLLIEGELEQGTPYLIKGYTPDSMDIFRYRVYLNNPKIGDTITFLNAGAYTYSTDFCNLAKLETVIID
ncbi:MAG: decarboxylase [Candidatus Aenigmarchaeota archaeon]|nr:decarboxylase [Candidatus Aenigmarchaeota archaeon]